MTGRILSKGALMVATGAFLMASVVSLASPVHAGLLTHGKGVGTGSPVDPPGDEISVYYDIGSNLTSTSNGVVSGVVPEPSFGTAPVGADNYATLINPSSNNLCAMIYVTDNSEELGECCGCFLSPQGESGTPGLDRFSVKQELVSNWGIPFGGSENVVGTIIVFAATPGPLGQCDPTGGYSPSTGTLASGGFTITPGLGLNGWILHLNAIVSSAATTTSVTEASFWDDGSGDPAEAVRLETVCGQLYANQSGAGHCTCPPETL